MHKAWRLCDANLMERNDWNVFWTQWKIIRGNLRYYYVLLTRSCVLTLVFVRVHVSDFYSHDWNFGTKLFFFVCGYWKDDCRVHFYFVFFNFVDNYFGRFATKWNDMHFEINCKKTKTYFCGDIISSQRQLENFKRFFKRNMLHNFRLLPHKISAAYSFKFIYFSTSFTIPCIILGLTLALLLQCSKSPLKLKSNHTSASLFFMYLETAYWLLRPGLMYKRWVIRQRATWKQLQSYFIITFMENALREKCLEEETDVFKCKVHKTYFLLLRRIFADRGNFLGFNSSH